MEIKVIKVWFEDESIFIKTDPGDIKSSPLKWFPRLHGASKALLEDFTLSPFGIHWEQLDEDLSYSGFYHYQHQNNILEKK